MKTAMGIILVFLTCSILLADQLTLQNGDKLSGTIVKSDEKSLVIKTDLEGEVTVQWTAVQAINSSQEFHVGLTSGQTFVGPITTRDSSLEIATKNAGIVTTPKNNVIFIRSDTEERAYEKSLHPGPMEGWEGGANVGFALTHGNSQTKNFALSFTADRKTLRDKTSLYANSVYATNNAQGVLASTTADAIRGGIRYDRDFTERVFGFAGADFQTDDLQNLNLRSVLGGGVGPARPQKRIYNIGSFGRLELYARKLLYLHPQFSGSHTGRGADPQAAWKYAYYPATLLLSRP